MNTGNIELGVTARITEVEFEERALKEMQARRDALSVRDAAYSAQNNSDLTKLEKFLGVLHGDPSVAADSNKEDARLIKFVGEQFDKISDIMTKGVNMAFDVVEDIYKEMKKASPLLQTLESLFNLAMQLFFMPLGNKLAEVLLPAVINLVETAAKMWDELGDGNLEQIFGNAIEYGINALSAFFKDTGKLLSDQGGILGSIGKVLEGVGGFIENNLLNVVNLILKATDFIINHLKDIIVGIVSFKAASLAMDVALMYVVAASETPAIGPLGATAIASAAAAAAGIGTDMFLSSQGFADGGIVPHTPGGRLVTVAENEDEVIMPRSRVSMGGNVTNNFYGYTSDDIREMIDRSVSEKISLSYIKGGY